MKKLFLLLAGTSITVASMAQSMSSISTNRAETHLKRANHTLAGPAKTTAGPGGSRWYSYVDEVLANDATIPGVTPFIFNMWNDTTAVFGFDNSGTPSYIINKWTSVGLSFNPMYYPYNDSDNLVGNGLIKISTTNAYKIDSVLVFGSYQRSSNAAKASVVDTLTIGMVYGNGSSSSNMPAYYFTGMASSYGSDTVRFLGVAHDSLHNTAGQSGGTAAPYIVKFPLTATDSASNFAKAFPVTFNVPAANFSAATVSFKSGDAAFTAFDTVQYADGSAKYHNFAMEDIAVGNSTAVAYPPYHPKDWTSGYWKREGYLDGGWGGDYIPNWAWTASTSSGAPTASDLQYPYIWYHVTCSTCDTIKNTAAVISVPKNLASVNAYPNPSSKEAVVSFTLINRADVTISVSDMTGKVIATQTIKNVEAGDARINTSTLPNGMYLYTVEASGERFNGKISVAH